MVVIIATIGAGEIFHAVFEYLSWNAQYRRELVGGILRERNRLVPEVDLLTQSVPPLSEEEKGFFEKMETILREQADLVLER